MRKSSSATAKPSVVVRGTAGRGSHSGIVRAPREAIPSKRRTADAPAELVQPGEAKRSAPSTRDDGRLGTSTPADHGRRGRDIELARWANGASRLFAGDLHADGADPVMSRHAKRSQGGAIFGLYGAHRRGDCRQVTCGRTAKARCFGARPPRGCVIGLFCGHIPPRRPRSSDRPPGRTGRMMGNIEVSGSRVSASSARDRRQRHRKRCGQTCRPDVSATARPRVCDHAEAGAAHRPRPRAGIGRRLARRE